MKKIIALVISLAPLAAFAQISNIDDVANKASSIGDTLIVLLISFSVIWIIISVVRYLIAGGEEDRKKGGMAILWGVVGLFVILSIWGLVAILTNSFATQKGVPEEIPRTLQVPSTNSHRNGGGYYNGVPLMDSPRQRLIQPDDQIQS